MRNGKLKKVLVLTMCVAMGAALTACGSSGGTKESSAGTKENSGGAAESGDKKVIGVTINHTQDVFMKNLESGVLSAAEDYADKYEVKCVEAGQDPAEQLSQVEQFVAEGVDCIVINPVNQESSSTAIEEAVAAGIPVMTVNTMSTDEAQAECFTYVGSDAITSGEIQGQYVAEHILNGAGKVAYITGVEGSQATIDRRAGWDNVMKDYPEIEIVLEGTGNYVQADAMELVENWLQTGEEIDCIVCQGADMAVGALLALEDAGKVGEIAISGIDMSEDIAAAIKDGTIANSVFQDAIGQGYGAVEYAAKYLEGEKLESIIDIPYELVTADNVDDYEGRY